MTNGKFGVLEFREREMVKKLSELVGGLNKSQIGLQEKFDMFRTYFRGIQDGLFIGLRSLDIEPTADQRPITEMRLDIIVNNVETGKKDMEDAWNDIDRELPLSAIYQN
jgi:hypothetical protein